MNEIEQLTFTDSVISMRQLNILSNIIRRHECNPVLYVFRATCDP